tara:strand:- start:362 stop:538 length:177 start_codon:yes stop_codon:yes gene_type:complete
MSETNLLVDFNVNPFVFDNLSLIEYNFYVSRIVNIIDERAEAEKQKLEEMKKNNGMRI